MERNLVITSLFTDGSRQIGPWTIGPGTVGPRTTGPRTIGPRGPVVRGPICHFLGADSWAPDSWAPGQLGPGQLGPRARLSGAQLSALKKWQIGPRTVGPNLSRTFARAVSPRRPGNMNCQGCSWALKGLGHDEIAQIWEMGKRGGILWDPNHQGAPNFLGPSLKRATQGLNSNIKCPLGGFGIMRMRTMKEH